MSFLPCGFVVIFLEPCTCNVLDFRAPVSYSRTTIVFVGIRYKHLRVQDERSESLYTWDST